MLPSGFEWVIFLFIALLLFGNRLPQVMRSLGQSVNEFKKGQQEGDRDENIESKGT